MVVGCSGFHDLCQAEHVISPTEPSNLPGNRIASEESQCSSLSTSATRESLDDEGNVSCPSEDCHLSVRGRKTGLHLAHSQAWTQFKEICRDRSGLSSEVWGVNSCYYYCIN